MRKIYEDRQILQIWEGLVGTTCIYEKIFKSMVLTFLTNRGNLAAKIVKEKKEEADKVKYLNKRKAQASSKSNVQEMVKSKKGLRKTFQKILKFIFISGMPIRPTALIKIHFLSFCLWFFSSVIIILKIKN